MIKVIALAICIINTHPITPLGEYRITYYTNSYADCQKTDGITYSGVIAKDGRTIAVDKSIIPLGSYLFIEGIGIRKAEDIGGAVKGKRIDVYVDKKTKDRPGRAKIYLLGGS